MCPIEKIRTDISSFESLRKGGYVYYAAAFKGDKRSVTLAGVNFRTAKHNIDEPLFSAL